MTAESSWTHTSLPSILRATSILKEKVKGVGPSITLGSNFEADGLEIYTDGSGTSYFIKAGETGDNPAPGRGTDLQT